MVEIFKTNVGCREEAQILIERLREHFPAGIINFDLEDCDNILRIEDVVVSNEKVTLIIKKYGYECEALN